MALELGINLSVVYQIDENPVETLVKYQKIASSHPTGDVSAEAKLSDIVMPIDIFKDVHRTVLDFTSSIISVHKITTNKNPDMPVELRILEAAPGITYNLQMATLDQDITWNIANQEITIHIAQAYNISLEAFIYYMNTLKDLITAIENL